MNSNEIKRHPSWGARLARLHCLVFGALAASCVYDADTKCGDLEVDPDHDRCLCPKGAVWTATGCIECGKNEMYNGTSCECKEGFARATPTDTCAKVPAGIGTPCDTANMPCVDSKFSFCQVTSGTTGYCTNSGCTSAADCEGGYACDTDTGTCLKPPTGWGTPCMSDADCAGTEATYCDTFVTHGCLVQGCTLMPDNCFVGTECCDLSSFGIAQPLCIAEGQCTTK